MSYEVITRGVWRGKQHDGLWVSISGANGRVSKEGIQRLGKPGRLTLMVDIEARKFAIRAPRNGDSSYKCYMSGDRELSLGAFQCGPIQKAFALSKGRYSATWNETEQMLEVDLNQEPT